MFLEANKGGSDGHTYSTTEQVIGTWVNGKPVYERTIYDNGNSVRGNINIASWNLDTLIWTFALDSDGAGNTFNLACALPGATVEIHVTSNKQTLAVNGRGTVPFVVVQYTKTTD